MPNYLPAPTIEFDPAKAQAFEALYQTAVAHGAAQFIDYTLPYPKYEFLSYLVARHPVLLHGSDNPAIEQFETIRRGYDTNPHGNVMGVYATNDGIWPIFFAVLDHKVYRGSMRNGVWYEPPDESDVDFPLDATPAQIGDARKLYQFSLNAAMLPQRPWAPGTIYILPRATFEQLSIRNSLLAEWASRVPVTPLAKLRVEPADFPFVDQVAGHDDSEVLATQDMIQRVVQASTRTEALPDGQALFFAWSEAQADTLLAFLKLLRKVMPVASVAITAEAPNGGSGELVVRVRGPETIKNLLGKLIVEHKA